MSVTLRLLGGIAAENVAVKFIPFAIEYFSLKRLTYQV